MDDGTTQLLDRLDVMTLVNRYGRSVDRRDWDALAAVFAEDATADYTSVVARIRREETTTPVDARPQGRDAIIAWLQAARAGGEELLHFMTNHIVEVDGDRATLWSYVHERQGAYGSYDIAAVRTDGGWRIQSLVLDLTPRPSKLA